MTDSSSGGVSGTYTGISYPPATGDWAYPFDSTGSAASNNIPNEIQTVSPNAASDFNWIIPLAAPFYRSSMTVTNQATGLDLVEGVDFVFGDKFIDASTSIGLPVYGSIVFLNNNFNGVVKLNYQTVGGAWVVPANQLAEMLANTTNNPIITTWDEIADLPYQFPPINHEFDLVDLKGVDTVVDAINGLTSAITGGTASGVSNAMEPGNYLVAADTLQINPSDNLNTYVINLQDPSCLLGLSVPVFSVGYVRPIRLIFIQGTGNNLLDWSQVAVTWANGGKNASGAPTLSTEQGAFDVIDLVYASPEVGFLGYIAS